MMEFIDFENKYRKEMGMNIIENIIPEIGNIKNKPLIIFFPLEQKTSTLKNKKGKTICIAPSLSKKQITNSLNKNVPKINFHVRKL
ncbi:hypothetical protein [Aminipila sp.]|uniref:hypothetical protein n=1 Tax=Aminipila sp. TaxID=2060095 RepID=UPI0028984CE1|nr:hypothetical protein [Aminipila sp.]